MSFEWLKKVYQSSLNSKLDPFVFSCCKDAKSPMHLIPAKNVNKIDSTNFFSLKDANFGQIFAKILRGILELLNNSISMASWLNYFLNIWPFRLRRFGSPRQCFMLYRKVTSRKLYLGFANSANQLSNRLVTSISKQINFFFFDTPTTTIF